MFRTLVAYIKRKLDPGEATHLVMVEPSMFRRDECYILGPFPWKQALRVAKREVRIHPHGETQVVSRHGTVMQGDEILRPADPMEGPSSTPVFHEAFEFRQYRQKQRELAKTLVP